MRQELIQVSKKFSGLLGDIWMSETEAYELYSTIFQSIRRRTRFKDPCLSTTTIPTEKTGEGPTDGPVVIPAVAAPAVPVVGVETIAQ
jgi:hypothetical protein